MHSGRSPQYSSAQSVWLIQSLWPKNAVGVNVAAPGGKERGGPALGLAAGLVVHPCCDANIMLLLLVLLLFELLFFDCTLIKWVSAGDLCCQALQCCKTPAP